MIDNNKLHDTILDMEASLSTNLNGYSMWHYGADIHGITRETLKNAIEVLKAQEPRVMTLEELDRLQEDDVVFVEIKPVRDLTCVSVELVRFIEKTQDPATQIELHTTDSAGLYMTRKTTDPNWRCWTSRPTDEQREGTPWN